VTTGDLKHYFSEEALKAFVASNYKIETPVIAIVDTSFLRTGFEFQLANGRAPRSLVEMRSGSVKAFIEGETLRETFKKFPKFARQLGVSEKVLRDLFVDEWMPNVKVVDLPEHLRDLDERSLAVRQRDCNDFAAASLAVLLSPCVLLTHDLDFQALGVSDRDQGYFAICLVGELIEGNAQVRATAMIPAAPIMVLGAGTKYAYDRYGPAALGILGLIAAGGVLLYLNQPVERRQAIKRGTGTALHALAEMYGEATATVQHAQRELRINLVPPSEDPQPIASILRVLATTSKSLSAQQLCDELEGTYSFNVKDVRAYLHAYKGSLFFEERRGGFRLGLPYSLLSERSSE
jgi:hypothetical protein